MKTNQQMSPSSSLKRKHPNISGQDKESDLQPSHEKRTKTDQQTQLSTHISTLPHCQSQNTIPDSISGSSMNAHKLLDNVSECSSSIQSTNAQPTPPQSSTVMYGTHMICDPHEIELYKIYQRARYQRTEFPTYFKGPNPSIKKFINLELVNKKRESREERVEGMKDKLHGNVTRYVQQREPLCIEQLAEVKEGEKLPRNILIEGDPGVGKTTLVWELCKGWGENRLLQQWDVVVLVQLRDVDAREASNLEELLDPDKQFGSELDYMKRTCGNGVMIIFDGYDELSEKQKQRTSVFLRLLVGRLLPAATLLVTSRPLATQELPVEFREQLHEHIEVVGFSDNDIDGYVKCKFCDTPDMWKDFQSYISSHPFIYKAMYIPLHCALVTDLYQTYWRKGKKEFAPKTITQLYTCFIHSLLERYLDDHPVYGPQELCVQEPADIPRDVFDDLMRLAELAAKGIREQEYVFDNLTHNTLGLMQRVNDSESRKSKSVSYSFLHLTLQEYLAALYWSKLSSEKVSPLFTETGPLPVVEYIYGHFWAEDKYSHKKNNIHWPVLHFYGGLTGVVGTPLENIFVGMKSSVNHNILYLLFETQNRKYISTLLKENQYQVDIRSKLQSYITGYCISHSSSTAKWMINDEGNHLLQSMISSTSSSSMGGMINGLKISKVTDYSKCFQMLFQLEKHTKALSGLSLFFSYSHSNFTHSKSHADNYICCDELSQLYKYCPKLISFRLDNSDNKLNCNPLFSSLHLMTCLETLDLTGILIDDSSHIVSNGLRQTTTLKSLILSNCALMNLSPEGLSQNKSIVSLKLYNIMMNIEGYKALKYFLIENINLKHLTLEGNLHHFNCPPNEEHSISFIIRKELLEGIQQSKSLKTLSLDNFQLLWGLEMISTNSSLTSLELNYLEMDKEGAMALKQVLIENTTFREIKLFHCIESMEVAEIVAEGLQYNTGVTKLVLCGIEGVGTLVQRLRNNTTLTSLELNSLEMKKEEAMSLKQVLIDNTTLREIKLFECIQSMEVAEVVAEGLQYNTGLTKLVLCGIEGVGTLVQRLRNNTTLTSLKLKYLEMDKEEAMSLKQVLIENTTFREIKLFHCIESMEVAEIVAEGLQYNTGVTKLVLCGIEGVGTLVQRLRNNTTLTSLELNSLEMEKEEAMSLKQVLIDNTTLREIELFECIQSMEVAEVVAEGLQYNTGITKLALWRIKGVGTLVQALQKNTTLTSLVLDNLEMDKEEAMALKHVLIENTTLREITLHKCIKSMEVAEVVAEGLQHNTGVTKLVLWGIERVGIVVQRLRNNTTLTSLVLGNLKMDKEEAMALKHVLIENTTLREIKLNECIKSMEVAEVVAEGLQYNTGVTKLVLGSIKGVGALVQRLRNNTTLTSLELNSLEMDKEEAMALKHVLIENTTLREIKLNECIKSMEVAEVVAEGLQYNTGVTKLVLCGIEGVGTLVQRLRNNTTLTSLELNSLEMDKEEAMSLKQVLIDNTTLREIELFECIQSMEVAEVVAEGLQYNTGITKLALWRIKGVGTLVQALQKNTTLTSLVLDNLEMDKEEAMALKHVLIENTTLREITLHKCIKSMEVAEVVAEGLQHNTGVTKLVLWGIERVGIVVQRLRNNTTLTSLVLGNLEMDKEEAMALKHVLIENTTLREIKLNECIKSMEVAEVVAEGLQYNTGVTKLVLGSIKGVGALVQRLRNNTTLTSLELNSLEMDKEEAMALKHVLIENTTLREIKLNECIKSMEVAEVVAEGLQYNTGITKLALWRIKGVGTLVQALQKNTTLTSLVLDSLEMDKEEAMALKHVLIENTTLREIELWYCIKSMEVAEVVAEGLQHNTGVTKLVLWGIERVGIIVQRLRNNTTLTSLVLGNLEMDKEEAMALKHVLIENTTLREIKLNECIKSMEVAEVVAEGLQYNTGVTKLVLGSIKGVGTLVQALQKNTTLTSLVFGYLEMDKEEAMALKHVLIENTTLREIKLYKCIKSIEVAEVVAEGLQYNTGVTKLVLWGIEWVGTLVQALQKNTTLTSLVFGYLEMDKEEAMALKHVLIENTTLREIKLYKCIKSIEVAKVVAEGLQYNTGVLKLTLARIEEKSVTETLIKGLSYNSSVQSLILCNNDTDYRVLYDLLRLNQIIKYVTIYQDIDLQTAKYLADTLVNSNLIEMRIFDKEGGMGQDGTKILADTVMKNNIKLVLSDRYQEYLSLYCYPVDRVMYKSEDECKLLYN